MDKLNRRAMMRGILCGAAVVGVVACFHRAQRKRLPVDASLANAPEELIEDVQWGRPPRHWAWQ